MLRLIADLNLNGERGEAGRTGERRRNRAVGGELERWAHSGKEICL